jgi:hypothetical protein
MPWKLLSPPAEYGSSLLPACQAASSQTILAKGDDDGQAEEEEWLPKRQKGRGQVKQRGSTRCPYCINVLEPYELCLQALQRHCATC